MSRKNRSEQVIKESMSIGGNPELILKYLIELETKKFRLVQRRGDLNFGKLKTHLAKLEKEVEILELANSRSGSLYSKGDHSLNTFRLPKDALVVHDVMEGAVDHDKFPMYTLPDSFQYETKIKTNTNGSNEPNVGSLSLGSDQRLNRLVGSKERKEEIEQNLPKSKHPPLPKSHSSSNLLANEDKDSADVNINKGIALASESLSSKPENGESVAETIDIQGNKEIESKEQNETEASNQTAEQKGKELEKTEQSNNKVPRFPIIPLPKEIKDRVKPASHTNFLEFCVVEANWQYLGTAAGQRLFTPLVPPRQTWQYPTAQTGPSSNTQEVQDQSFFFPSGVKVDFVWPAVQKLYTKPTRYRRHIIPFKDMAGQPRYACCLTIVQSYPTAEIIGMNPKIIINLSKIQQLNHSAKTIQKSFRRYLKEKQQQSWRIQSFAGIPGQGYRHTNGTGQTVSVTGTESSNENTPQRRNFFGGFFRRNTRSINQEEISQPSQSRPHSQRRSDNDNTSTLSSRDLESIGTQENNLSQPHTPKKDDTDKINTGSRLPQGGNTGEPEDKALSVGSDRVPSEKSKGSHPKSSGSGDDPFTDTDENERDQGDFDEKYQKKFSKMPSLRNHKVVVAQKAYCIISTVPEYTFIFKVLHAVAEAEAAWREQQEQIPFTSTKSDKDVMEKERNVKYEQLLQNRIKLLAQVEDTMRRLFGSPEQYHIHELSTNFSVPAQGRGGFETLMNGGSNLLNRFAAQMREKGRKEEVIIEWIDSDENEEGVQAVRTLSEPRARKMIFFNPIAVEGYINAKSFQFKTLLTTKEWASAVLFSLLDSQIIFKIINLLLMERSIIIYGKSPGIVTSVTLAVLNIISPFIWEGIFVPLLPDNARELFQAPVPLILGTTSEPNISEVSAATAVLHLNDDTAVVTTSTGDLSLKQGLFSRASPIPADPDQSRCSSPINGVLKNGKKKSYSSKVVGKVSFTPWFVRLPEVTADMPVDEEMGRRLDYLRQALCDHCMDKLEFVETGLKTDRQSEAQIGGRPVSELKDALNAPSKPLYIATNRSVRNNIDAILMSDVPLNVLHHVRTMMASIKRYNFGFCGKVALDPRQWKRFLRRNPGSGGPEFYPEYFMEPIRNGVEFQDAIAHTQLFVSFMDKLRREHMLLDTVRAFIGHWIYFRVVILRKSKIKGGRKY